MKAGHSAYTGPVAPGPLARTVGAQATCTGRALGTGQGRGFAAALQGQRPSPTHPPMPTSGPKKQKGPQVKPPGFDAENRKWLLRRPDSESTKNIDLPLVQIFHLPDYPAGSPALIGFHTRLLSSGCSKRSTTPPNT